MIGIGMRELIHKVFTGERVVLLCIFLLTFFLRVWNLGTIPYGFHRDEVANTYIGRFIFLNGQDIYGNPWPLLYVDKFGDYPPVIPMYLAGAATFLFGLNSFAARFPAALAGSLLVFPLYWFLRNLLNKKVATIGIILLAVLPWHIVLSRAGAEGIIALTVFVYGLVVLMSGLSKHSNKRVVAGLVLILFTYLLYPAFRILTPLVLVPMPFLFKKRNRTISPAAVTVVCVAIAATVAVSMTTWGKGRFLQTSLFSNPTEASNLQNEVIGQIFDDKGQQVLITRVFHNRAVAYTRRFAELYIGYFSPTMLFLKGGLPPRYSVVHMGLLPFVIGLSFLFSLFFPFRIQERKGLRYLLYLLLIAPLPGVLTVDDSPNIHRAVWMIVPLIGLGAAGLSNVFDNLFSLKSVWKRVGVGFICVFVVSETLFSLHQYYGHAGKQNSYTRNDGAMEMARFLFENKGAYEKIYVPYKDWLPLYYLFYTNRFDASLVGVFEPDFVIRKLDTIEFLSSECSSHENLKFYTQETTEKILIIDRADCAVLPEYKEEGVITRFGGTNVYRMLTPIRKL